MSPNEKLQHRDDPELSPLHRYAIGCTISGTADEKSDVD